MNQNLTAHELAAQLHRSATEVDEAVGAVVEAAAYRVRGDAFDRVSRSGESDKASDSHRFAARQIDAEPDGELAMTVGYDNRIADLAAAVEYGSTTIAPGGQLATALEAEAPRFGKTVMFAALKRMR